MARTDPRIGEEPKRSFVVDIIDLIIASSIEALRVKQVTIIWDQAKICLFDE